MDTFIICKELASEMIEKDPVKAAWIFWDGFMKEIALTDSMRLILEHIATDGAEITPELKQSALELLQ